MTTATHNYGWLMPDPGGSANTWGNTLNGTTQAIDSQVAVLGNQVQPNALVVSRGPDGGNYGMVDFLNYGSSLSRWQMSVTSETESGGSNTGSNFVLAAIDNSGTIWSPALSITRSTQNATFSQSLTVNGNIIGVNGLVIAQATAGGNSIFEMTNNVGTNMGYLGWNASNNSVNLTNTNGNGTISIGTDGSANMSSVLNVGGAMFVYGGVIYNLAPSSGNSNYYFMRHDGSVAGIMYYNVSVNALVLQNQAGGGIIQIDNAGNFRANAQAFKPGGGVWSDSSDARVKTVTGAYSAGLDQIAKLNPVRFTYKGNDGDAHALVKGKEFVGLVADEAMRVMPELVSLKEGEIDGRKVNDLKSLDATAIIYALCNSVKELKAEIEALKAGR